MMFYTVKLRAKLFPVILTLIIIVILLITNTPMVENNIYAYNENLNLADAMPKPENAATQKKSYIKWVDFNIPYTALEQALSYDIKSYGQEPKLNWIELLAYSAAKCGGNFSGYKRSLMDSLVSRLKAGESIDELTRDLKYYPYYLEAYTAVLGGWVGEYEVQTPETMANTSGEATYVKKYGLRVFSPLAKGYGANRSKDFGNARSYGFKRRHLGHDLMGSIGTPIIAVEGGTVEAMGWNAYGGWRIGIRSHDKKRYYYYAHLRKDHPFHYSISEGDTVKAGDVIGYLGMTGYSLKENVNNMKVPHLHFGMQLIFDESQKEGNNEIWIDVYNLYTLLEKNKSAVFKNEETKDYHRAYDIRIPETAE